MGNDTEILLKKITTSTSQMYKPSQPLWLLKAERPRSGVFSLPYTKVLGWKRRAPGSTPEGNGPASAGVLVEVLCDNRLRKGVCFAPSLLWTVFTSL